MSLAKKIKKYRKEKKLTQLELSKNAGVPQSLISEIENYKRKNGILTSHLIKIAAALGISAAILLDESDTETEDEDEEVLSA